MTSEKERFWTRDSCRLQSETHRVRFTGFYLPLSKGSTCHLDHRDEIDNGSRCLKRWAVCHRTALTWWGSSSPSLPTFSPSSEGFLYSNHAGTCRTTEELELFFLCVSPELFFCGVLPKLSAHVFVTVFKQQNRGFVDFDRSAHSSWCVGMINIRLKNMS